MQIWKDLKIYEGKARYIERKEDQADPAPDLNAPEKTGGWLCTQIPGHLVA